MRWFIWLWLMPVSYMTVWYALSVRDFGYIMFSREVHDRVFQMYGAMLGLEPETIPPLLFKALFVDSLIVLAVVLFFRRKRILAWWRDRSAATA